jgi:hypothetical protein
VQLRPGQLFLLIVVSIRVILIVAGTLESALATTPTSTSQSGIGGDKQSGSGLESGVSATQIGSGTSAADSGATALELRPHPLVQIRRPNPSHPAAIRYRGYLGDSAEERKEKGFWRLYSTPEAIDYFEFHKDDCVSFEEGDETKEDCIWLKPNATILRPELVGSLPVVISSALTPIQMTAGLTRLFFMLPLMPWAFAALASSLALEVMGGGFLDTRLTSCDRRGDRHYDLRRVGPDLYIGIPT